MQDRRILARGAQVVGLIALTALASLLVRPVELPAQGLPPIKIAFVRNDDLWVMNPNGSQQQQLTFNRGITSPTWSPDRMKIAYVTIQASKQNVYLLSLSYDGQGLVHTGAETQVTFGVAGDYGTEFSPDGSRIAIHSLRDGDSDIYVVDLATLELRQLTGVRDTAGDAWPTWSPDSTKIAFLSNRTGSYALWMIDAADGGNPRQILDLPGIELNPSWSPVRPDGTSQIGFPLTDNGSTLWVLDMDPSYNPLGVHQIPVSGTDPGSPTWSPDSLQMALGISPTKQSRYADIFTMSASGSNQTNVTATSRQGEGRPSWDR